MQENPGEIFPEFSRRKFPDIFPSFPKFRNFSKFVKFHVSILRKCEERVSVKIQVTLCNVYYMCILQKVDVSFPWLGMEKLSGNFPEMF